MTCTIEQSRSSTDGTRSSTGRKVNLSCDIVEVDKLNQDADVDFYLGD